MKTSKTNVNLKAQTKNVYGLLVVACCTLSLMTPAVLANLFGIDRDSSNLYTVSTTDASLSLIGNAGIPNMGSLELGVDGFLYGFTTGSNATLYKINPSSAIAVAVGPLNIGFVFEGGLVIAPDGTAYGANQNSASSPVLFTVNLSTGAATIIGTISGGSHDINGLAWRSDGKLVGLDRETNSLLAITPATAVSSVIAAVSPTVGSVGGMAAVGDMGYFATSGPGTSFPGSNELYSFDLFTGQHVLVGSFAPTISGTGLGGLAVPEPATIGLLLGALSLLRRKKIKQKFAN